MRILLVLAALSVLVTGEANAQAVADNLTCQQAIRAYEQNGRIYKRVGGQTIPIYDGVPASQRNRLKCSPVGVHVRTTDNPRCPVAYKCYPRGHGGGP